MQKRRKRVGRVLLAWDDFLRGLSHLGGFDFLELRQFAKLRSLWLARAAAGNGDKSEGGSDKGSKDTSHSMEQELRDDV